MNGGSGGREDLGGWDAQFGGILSLKGVLDYKSCRSFCGIGFVKLEDVTLSCMTDESLVVRGCPW